jgi:phosphoserine phosphatase RsbU/P
MVPESSQQSSDRLSMLYRLSQTFNSSLDFDEVLNLVMDEVIVATQAERGFVMLKTEEGTLDIRVARGIDRNTVEGSDFQISRGVVERVAESGNPVLTSDAQMDDRFSARNSVMLLGLRSILCVPLKLKDRVLGVIYVDNRIQAGIFNEADLDLMNAIGANAAIAIENARLFHEAQRRFDSLRFLHEISIDLTSTLEIDDVLLASLKRISELLGAQEASILTAEDDQLIFQITTGGNANALKPFRIPIRGSAAGWVLQNNQGVIINDVYQDERFDISIDEKTGFETRNIIAAPLIIKERAIGVIEVVNKSGGFTQADLELLDTIGSSAAIAIENARLYQVAVEKGRMERELQMARRVQYSLLPDKLPEIAGWEFAVLWQPAREVAGDYYDFIRDDLNLGMVVADVTDKGMPAALFMAFTRSIIRASMNKTQHPQVGIKQANRLICLESTRGLFVTLFYAQLDSTKNILTYVNAGHNPPLFYRAHNDILSELTKTGMALGIDEDTQYEQRTVNLDKGDFILLYTDGITEAFDASNHQFGNGRLRSVVYQNRYASADQLLSAIGEAVESFIASTPPTDDITIMIAKKL